VTQSASLIGDVGLGDFVALPNFPIGTPGNIFVPYTGQVPAAGKTLTQVDQEIVDRIKNRAIEPQAVVRC
jgi:polysaccharide biosynthesis/export protein